MNAFCGPKSSKYLAFISPYIFLQKKINRGLFQKNKADQPKKILVSNWANLGDVVLATSVLPALKEAFPQCEIGFLLAPHTKIIVENHPLVSHVHVIDNWFLKWKTESTFKTFMRFVYATFFLHGKVIKAIKEQKYDLAIELYPFFPNTENVFWKAKIPYRLGFSSTIQSQLLSKGVSIPEKIEYMPKMYNHLLKELNCPSQELSPCLQTESIELSSVVSSPDYIVFHMGTTDQSKEWSRANWQELIERSTALKRMIYFTGKGSKENADITSSIKKYPFCKNVCNILDWAGFVNLIKNAKLIVTVDSVSAHIAAAYDVTSVVIYLNTPSVDLWNPGKKNGYPIFKDEKGQIHAKDVFDLVNRVI